MPKMNACEILPNAFAKGVAACSATERLPSYLPDTAPQGRTIVLGAGKAAGEMAAVAARNLIGAVEGLVITRYGHGPEQETGAIRVVEGGHPVPDENSYDTAREMLALAEAAGPNDRVIFLISGGGSALLSYPIDGVTIEEKRELNRQLVTSGASIADINFVRSHFSKIKGGRLAAAARPAELLTFVISDVPGDDPALVASGPSIASAYDPDKVEAIMKKNHLKISDDMRRALRNHRGVADIDHPVSVIAKAADALQAIDDYLRSEGWATHLLGDDLEGDARQLGAEHAKLAKAYADRGERLAIVSGGELTVRVVNPDGKGGPNLEYLTSLMINLDGAKGISAIACDSDGIDGSEDNAGGLISPSTLNLVRDAGEDPEIRLLENRTYDLFKACNGLVITGPTRTNVNDIRIILVDSA